MIAVQQATDCPRDTAFLHECFTSPQIQGEFQRTRAVDREAVRAEIESQAHADRYLFIVADDGRYIGYGYLFRSSAFSQFEIGVTLVPGARHRGYGLEAHRLLVARAVADGRAGRLVAYTCVGNVRERSILERCGFRHEGTMRQAGVTGGVAHDIAVYGALQPELEVAP